MKQDTKICFVIQSNKDRLLRAGPLRQKSMTVISECMCI